MHKKIKQTLTLLLFVSLITGFVLYRSGGTKNMIEQSPNTGIINYPIPQSPDLGDSMEVDPSFPSSKSIVLRRKTKAKTKTFTLDSLSKSEREGFLRLSSSKSAIIFKPDLKFDTTKIKRK